MVSNDHQPALMLLPVAGVTANFTALPFGAVRGVGVMIPDMMSTGFMAAENARIPIGGSVAVFGIGPVGLCSIAGAKLRGAGRIFAVGTRVKPVEVAKKEVRRD